MKRIRTELAIAAAPSAVFAVLTDFARYGAWNPVITKLNGEPALGRKVSFRIEIPGLLPLKLSAKLTTFEPGRKLAWTGGARGVMLGEHYFEVVPDGNGSRIIHGEDFSGAISHLMPGRLVDKIQAAYGKANEALRTEVTRRAAAN